MIELGGYLWPMESGKWQKAILDAVNIPMFLDTMKRFGVAVQAGGNIGIYPAALSARFRTVMTFEPDAENFACLQKNVAHLENVKCYSAALGAQGGVAALERHPTNCGMHKIAKAGVPVQMYSIDDFKLPICDLIWLDTEGYEHPILEGAADTIRRHSPVVIIERGPLYMEYGEERPGVLLKKLNYTRHLRIGKDTMYVRG